MSVRGEFVRPKMQEKGYLSQQRFGGKKGINKNDG
jgi:hypothetical protein